ncbi:histidine acid phosphatase superfamily protein [Babesia divergens]|uniref:Inositol hexakisphosphate and diphosphoinositol-pentakisphosphate kinase n=1 Tax=Babesia divergens TaxID=32595 RepID=A0AAD9GDD6_BABDI|nr:histidine acid phosphatase superfamily protein [Babesia divergens]
MDRVFTLGICAMASKVEGKPMQSILGALRQTGDFEIIIFPEETILRRPITEWPVVECLIAFYSTNFPLEKAIDYVKRYKPIVLNDVEKQKYSAQELKCIRSCSCRNAIITMQACHIPHPNYIVVDHNAVKKGKATFEEHYDYIIYNNVRINKPFIEKSVDSDDHNNWIYYPTNTGGGCKKLFRKIQDRSSKYRADIHAVRRDGTYIYEEFMSTFGTDIKVYTVGCMFAHAEGRKSPTLDGKVNRNKDGKEVRFPVILTTKEKVIAYRIVEHFGQVVCGFDILRTMNGPYVCDINGWSFVKHQRHHSDHSYHVPTKAAKKYNIILGNVIPARIVTNEMAEALKKTFVDVEQNIENSETQEELCSVVVIMRHGDRKPKQKLKILTTHHLIMQYFYGRTDAQIKLKSPEEMDGFAKVNTEILKELREQISQCNEDGEINATELKMLNERLEQHKELERMLHTDDGFAGINRKIQLKASLHESGAIKHILIVAKWGGELTPVGKCQAEDLGRRFRQSLYPTDCSGLIRLHSSYRHDFKIFSSDEGRCQVTSAAFTKGILDLEGELTPILVAMTIRDNKAHMLLDDNIEVKERNECKARLSKIMENWQNKEELDALLANVDVDDAKYYLKAIEDMKFQISDMHKLTSLLNDFMSAIEHEITKWMYLYSIDEYATSVLYTLQGMFARWKALTSKLRKADDEKFQFTMIADIVDNLRYDLIHYHTYLGGGLDIAFEIYNLVEPLSAVLSPCEYGVTPKERLAIGVKVAGRLLQKIIHDVTLHKNSSDDSNRSVDQQRSRDELYAMLVEQNVHEGNNDNLLPTTMSRYYGSDMCGERMIPQEGTLETEQTHGSSQHMVRKWEGEPFKKISLLASASASAASVAASSLAVISDSTKGLRAYPKMAFIGGIKPSEMNCFSKRTNMEELWARLSKGDALSEPVVINSNALWVHCKAEDKTEDGNAEYGTVSKSEEGDMGNQGVNEANEMSTLASYRMVRSRYYVTSASMLFSLLNFFKYAHYLEDNPDESKALVNYKTRDLHYLSHIVLRVWRSTGEGDKRVYRLEIMVSPGAKDGFGQNYDMLAENARSQKHKYKRHISRFNLDYVRGKVLCKLCGDIIDPEFVRAQFRENMRSRSHEYDKLKRSASTTSLKMNRSSSSATTSKFASSRLDTSATITDETPKATRWYLCKKCVASTLAHSSTGNASTMSSKSPIVSRINESPAKVISVPSSRDNSVSRKDGASKSDRTPKASFSKAVVPPYCELSRLAVINESCDLTRLENLVLKVS